MRARLVRTTTSVRRPDSDDFSALVSPGWHAVDHRSLGLLSMDLESRYEVHLANGEEGVPGQVSELIHPADVLRISPDGWVVCNVRRTLNEHGDEFVRSWVSAVEIDPDSDQHRSVHLFDPTDVDAAIARLGSLSAPPIVTDHEPWNTADRLTHHAWASHDWAPYIADEIVAEDRRAMMAVVTEGRDATDEAFGVLDHLQTSVTTIAARRDDLVLVRIAANRVEMEWDWLAIYQFADGLCVRIIAFDPDDLTAAVEELTRLATDTTDVETLFINAQLSMLASASTAGDRRRLGWLLAPNVAWVDHRKIGYGVHDAVDLERRVVARDELTDHFVIRVSRDLRHDMADTCTAMSLVEGSGAMSDGGTVETSYMIVARADGATGLGTHIEQFEVDDLVSANARFDAWLAERTWRPVNDAVLLGGLVNVCARAELADDALARFADNFTARLLDGSTVTRHDLVADVATLGSLGFGVAERTVLAVRGNRFALVESVDEADSTDRRLVVHEIDHEAHITRQAVFGPTDLRAAIDVLRDWSRPDGLTADTLGVRWERALLDLDPDTVAELTTDDFETVDHHPLSLLNMSRDEFLELQRRADPDGAGFDFAACIHRSSDHGFVTSNSVNSPFSANGTGHEHPLVVGLFRNGKVWRQESYPQDRLDDAIARYEQHVREVTGGGADHDGPTNRADRLRRERLDADGVSASGVQTLAVRGDDLALHYVDADGPRIDLTQWGDDQLLEHATYTPDQFDDALADLDERHLQRLHPVEAARLAFIAGFWRAFAKGDIGEYAPRAAYDTVDHRPLGWAADHSFDDRLLTGVGDLTWVDQIHHLDDGLVCNTRTTVRGGLGSVLTQRQINLIDHVPRNGRRRTEFFDVDDLDAALERRRQWMAERADQPVASNDAFIVDELADDVARNLPLDRFMTLLAPDFEATLADGRTINRADLEAGRATPADLGYGSGVRDLFATRFDDLAVIEIVSDDGTPHWAVVELDGDRLLRRRSTFDARRDAGVLLDQATVRSLQLTATAGARTLFDFGRSLRESDVDAAIELLAPDLIVVDHRPIGLGTMDRDGYAASVRSAMSFGSTTFTRSFRQADGTALSAARTYYPGAGGGVDFVDTATLLVTDGEHVTRIEHFDPDDMAAAVARYDELAAETPAR